MGAVAAGVGRVAQTEVRLHDCRWRVKPELDASHLHQCPLRYGAGCGNKIGGEVYVDANSNLSHQGERLYTGDFGATMKNALSSAVGAPEGQRMRITGLENLKRKE
jgi:hypothetical protein